MLQREARRAPRPPRRPVHARSRRQSARPDALARHTRAGRDAAVPRLLRATLKPPVPVTIPSGPSSPHSRPKASGCRRSSSRRSIRRASPDALTFFGSVDARTRCCGSRIGAASARAAANDGDACAIDLDCDGGDLRRRLRRWHARRPRLTSKRRLSGAARCGVLFDAAAFAALAHGRRADRRAARRPRADGICQARPTTRARPTATAAGDSCVSYALQAQNPVSLDSLTTAGPTISALHGRGDPRRRRSNRRQRCRATSSSPCRTARPADPAARGATGSRPAARRSPPAGSRARRQGRAIVQVPSGPFALPALALEGHVAAFVESENGEGSCDENGDGDEPTASCASSPCPANERTATSPRRAPSIRRCKSTGRASRCRTGRSSSAPPRPRGGARLERVSVENGIPGDEATEASFAAQISQDGAGSSFEHRRQPHRALATTSTARRTSSCATARHHDARERRRRRAPRCVRRQESADGVGRSRATAASSRSGRQQHPRAGDTNICFGGRAWTSSL